MIANPRLILFIYIGLTTFFYSCQSTPSTPVTTTHYKISHEPGVYEKAFELTIETDNDIAIYYTLNGMDPIPGTDYSFKYSKTIPIQALGKENAKHAFIPTTPLEKVRLKWVAPEACHLGYSFNIKAFIADSAISKSAVYSYFVRPSTRHSFPIIALTTSEENLFSAEKGMFVTGKYLDSTRLERTGNYFQNWKNPCFMEFFSKEGKLVFAQQVDMKIHGLKSPAAPQKSIRLYAKSKYDAPFFNYPFFSSDTLSKFKRLALRSFFTSWGERVNADVIYSKVAESFNVDISKSTPVLLYINGAYWGIENLRERIDKYYIASHYNLPLDSINIVHENRKASTGSSKAYVALYKFIETNDLSIDSNYHFVINQFDLESLLDYFILQTYFNNTDWPNNNHVLWKSNAPHSKWRYILYDLDAVFINYKAEGLLRARLNVKSNKIDKGTMVFGNLIKNKNFKTLFINRYKATLKDKLSVDNIISVIDNFEEIYAENMHEHIKRWHYPTSYEGWLSKNEHMRDYARNRGGYVLRQLKELEKL